MNEKQSRVIADLANAAYSIAAVAIVVYAMRSEIRGALAAYRREVNKRRDAIEERAKSATMRAGFHRSEAFRDSIARQEANAVENLDSALDDFNNA